MGTIDDYLKSPPVETRALFAQAMEDAYRVAEHESRSHVEQYLRLSKEGAGQIDIVRDRGIWFVGMREIENLNSYPVRAWAYLLGEDLIATSADEQARYLIDHWAEIHVLVRQSDISARLKEAATQTSPFRGRT